MLRFQGFVTLSLVVLMVSTAAAQEEGGRRRGGFGGGFGGPFGGAFSSPAALVGMPEVQKEIKANKAQKKKLDAGLAEMRGSFNFQALQNLSGEDRAKGMAEIGEKMAAAGKVFEEKMNKILKPEQLDRLKQLSLQRQGAMALLRPEMAKDLGLTEEQQKKAQEIQESSRPAGRFNFQQSSPEERQKWMAENRERQEKTQAELLAVLTDEQKAKFAEMKGKEFKFPEPRFGGANRERRRQRPKQE